MCNSKLESEGNVMTKEEKQQFFKTELRNQIRSILKDFHYESEEQHMSKDVVIALENLVGALK
jgi:adenylyl- and sulfurtransferase ThiI